ncbi:MAG TPA: MFS transporter [Actinophytocola sp.]|uniref:MFS transporter n=1 Tax=Actinophytocola sp. TaxID=1872138 RepID=UPI002DB59087|nr:MFS transporter [Actinophytocola sp.]HEU5471166.1 MFS transporter [Actinophytocola sp.]
MRSGKTAVLVVFLLQGAAFGSWAPRVPAIAEQVRADTGTFGLALVGASIGLILAAPVAGRLCARFGARPVVLTSALVAWSLLAPIALATNPAQLGLVLFAIGVSAGTLDVAMNIAAVTVVRQTGRPLMPVFHAGYSFGGLIGAAGAAVAATYGWAPLEHFGVVAVLAALTTLGIARRVPNEPVLAQPGHRRRRGGAGLARRPVLWLLGAVALCSAVAEGASADWSALFAVRERGVSEAAAAIIFAAFSVAMAVTRMLGERAERRWGPQRLLVGGALVAGSGLLIAVLVPAPWSSYLGFALAGAGLAYAFPVALGLAGAAGRRADGSGGERELAFVTAIAYSGFLLGPPMIGAIAQVTNLAVALGVAGVIAALIAPAALAAGWARRREDRPDQALVSPEAEPGVRPTSSARH